MTTYDIGDVLIVQTTVSQNGSPVDPASVVFEWRWSTSPTATTWTYGVDTQVTRVGVGVYEASVPLTQSGTLFYGWRTTNPDSAEQSRIRVVPWRPNP